MARPVVPAARPAAQHDHEVVAVLHPGPAEVRRARALIDAIDRDPRIGADEVLRRLQLPPVVLAALGATSGDFARGSSEYTSLLAVLLDTIAAGCTVRLVAHTPAPVPAGR
jgi:hypothetical protein